MRKMLAVAVAVLLAGGFSAAEKLELKPYGFIKGEALYVMGGVESFGKANLMSSQAATGTDTTLLGFTAQNTRFGLKGSMDVDGKKIGGRLELDFWALSWNANANPRLRLAYLCYAPNDMLELRFGQQWDVISPNNPATNNTGANLWRTGNVGFRRPQIQARIKKDLGGAAAAAQLSLGETAKEGAAGFGADNLSGMPLIQGHAGATIAKKVTVGLGGVYASYGADGDYTTSGFMADFNLNLHKLFALKGEFNMGSNLYNANLLTIAGSTGGQLKTGVDTTAAWETTTGDTLYNTKDITFTDTIDHTSTGIWVCAVSKPLNWLHLAAGFGMDINGTDALAAGKLEKNQTVYFDLIFPVAPQMSLALEYQMLMSAYKDGDTESASIINFSAKLGF